MGVQYNTSIVTSGLIFCLDAANTKSYPGSGTAWNDLSGSGLNGTLANGPTFSSANSGSIVFDGIDDNVNRSASINTGQNFTFGVWLNPTAVGTTRRCIMANAQNWPNIDSGWYFSVGQTGGNNRFFLSVGADNAYGISSNDSVSTGVWQYLVATVASGGLTINLYRNGILQTQAATLSSSRTISYSKATYYIAQRDPTAGGDYYTGNIGQISIYNRILTAAEINQNFNALRGRYGI